jgi:hypothetical protein
VLLLLLTYNHKDKGSPCLSTMPHRCVGEEAKLHTLASLIMLSCPLAPT